MKEIKLPSGATLELNIAPFAEGKALYQAVAEEMKTVSMGSGTKFNMMKDFFCTFIASKKIEACVDECAKRARYNKQPITKDTWEPEEARQDYIEAMYEIANLNTAPFMKSLYAKFSQALGMMPGDDQG